MSSSLFPVPFTPYFKVAKITPRLRLRISVTQVEHTTCPQPPEPSWGADPLFSVGALQGCFPAAPCNPLCREAGGRVQTLTLRMLSGLRREELLPPESWETG